MISLLEGHAWQRFFTEDSRVSVYQTKSERFAKHYPVLFGAQGASKGVSWPQTDKSGYRTVERRDASLVWKSDDRTAKMAMLSNGSDWLLQLVCSS